MFFIIPGFIIWLLFNFFKLISIILYWIFFIPVSIFNKGYSIIEKAYPSIILFELRNKIIVISISLFFLFIAIEIAGNLGLELIPQLIQGEYKVEFELPPGTPIEKSDKTIENLSSKNFKSTKIKTIFSVAGSGNKMTSSSNNSGENSGEINVILKKGSSKTDEIHSMDEMRKVLDKISGMTYKFSRPALFSFKTPIEVEIKGFNLDSLKLVNDKVVKTMKEMDIFSDIKSTIKAGHPEIEIVIDREKSAFYGLQAHDIAQRIVSKVKGKVATKYSIANRKIDVVVRSDKNKIDSVEKVKNLIVNSEMKTPLPLKTFSKINLRYSQSEIRRSELQRVATISANIKKGDLGKAADKIGKAIRNIQKPSGVFVSVSGQNQEMKTSFDSLKMALLFAIFLVYLVMASQFESFIHHFIIIFSIPLALIGAVFALYLTGTSVNVVVFIGAILLSGIVVNNAIVLIDLINQLRKKGVQLIEAIAEAGKLRLRSIMMTTLTTTLGLIPLAAGFGDGAELRAPMAITVIGGLIFSTMLTLILIPVLYYIVENLRQKA